jgi:hypothetical protein
MGHLQVKRGLAASLVVCILLVGGLASAQSIAHESHHAHHQQATHGTVLCSWMCAAGQVLDGGTAPTLDEQPAVALPDFARYLFVPHVVLDSLPSRGPPSAS